LVNYTSVLFFECLEFSQACGAREQISFLVLELFGMHMLAYSSSLDGNLVRGNGHYCGEGGDHDHRLRLLVVLPGGEEEEGGPRTRPGM
jgi:hypothetical protein